jgi:hypothetical protein
MICPHPHREAEDLLAPAPIVLQPMDKVHLQTKIKPRQLPITMLRMICLLHPHQEVVARPGNAPIILQPMDKVRLQTKIKPRQLPITMLRMICLPHPHQEVVARPGNALIILRLIQLMDKILLLGDEIPQIITNLLQLSPIIQIPPVKITKLYS